MFCICRIICTKNIWFIKTNINERPVKCNKFKACTAFHSHCFAFCIKESIFIIKPKKMEAKFALFRSLFTVILLII